jgi:hypothetical protein
MPIAAASEALARHLRNWLVEERGAEAWPIEAMTLPEARTKPGHGIALVLWRVQPDEPAGDTSPLRTASKGDPPEGGGLKLRYLLVVRGTDAATEQTMLARCMEVLDRHPVIEEPGSAANIAAEALVVAVETPADDAYLRLTEACGDPPPLLVPYVARSVRLHPPVAGHIPDAPPDAEPAA